MNEPREMMTVYGLNHTEYEYVNRLGRSGNVKPGGAYSNHWTEEG